MPKYNRGMASQQFPGDDLAYGPDDELYPPADDMPTWGNGIGRGVPPLVQSDDSAISALSQPPPKPLDRNPGDGEGMPGSQYEEDLPERQSVYSDKYWEASSPKDLRDAQQFRKIVNAGATGLEVLGSGNARMARPETFTAGFNQSRYQGQTTPYEAEDIDTSALRAVGDERVAEAEKERADKIGREAGLVRTRKAERDFYDQDLKAKDMERRIDPNSPVSKQASMLVQRALLARAAEAQAAGDMEGANALRQQAKSVIGLSAADAMSLYKGIAGAVDYRDVISANTAQAKNEADTARLGALTKREDQKAQQYKQKRETDMRSRLDSSKQYRNIQEMRRVLNEVDDLKGSGTPTDDQAIVTLFNKMTDPNSAVMQGEYDRSKESLSLAQRARLAYQTAIKGGSLTPEMRRGMISTMKRLGAGAERYAEEYLAPYEAEIARDNLDRDVIFGPSKGQVQAPQSGSVKIMRKSDGKIRLVPEEKAGSFLSNPDYEQVP